MTQEATDKLFADAGFTKAVCESGDGQWKLINPDLIVCVDGSYDGTDDPANNDYLQRPSNADWPCLVRVYRRTPYNIEGYCFPADDPAVWFTDIAARWNSETETETAEVPGEEDSQAGFPNCAAAIAYVEKLA